MIKKTLGTLGFILISFIIYMVADRYMAPINNLNGDKIYSAEGEYTYQYCKSEDKSNFEGIVFYKEGEGYKVYHNQLKEYKIKKAKEETKDYTKLGIIKDGLLIKEEKIKMNLNNIYFLIKNKLYFEIGKIIFPC